MNPDGSSPVALTSGPGSVGGPAWSPGGCWLIYGKLGYSGSEFWRMNADSTGNTMISNSLLGDQAPDLSPDGTRIVFQRGDQIWVMNVDGSGQVPLTTGPDSNFNPTWSADGTKILFASDRLPPASGGYDNCELYSMNADGTGLALLFGTLHSGWMVRENPLGGSYYATDFALPNFQLNRFDAAGNAAGSIPCAYQMNFSPDGSMITYVGLTCGGGATSQIYVANEDGTGPTNISNSANFDRYPDWR